MGCWDLGSSVLSHADFRPPLEMKPRSPHPGKPSSPRAAYDIHKQMECDSIQDVSTAAAGISTDAASRAASRLNVRHRKCVGGLKSIGAADRDRNERHHDRHSDQRRS
jgi:hypothetical protein